MANLHSIVRRVLLEADYRERGVRPRGSRAPVEEGYREDAKELASKIGDEAGRWTDAAKELGTDVLSGAATVGRAALNTLVGQAHAPTDDEDVRRAQASHYTLQDIVFPAAGNVLGHIVQLRFKIGAKVADAAGLPVRDIIAGKYGEDVMKDIFAGSVLHDILTVASFAPGGMVPAMLIDAMVYAVEGDRKSAVAVLAMAGVFHAGGKVQARKMDDARRGVIARVDGMEILSPKKYQDLGAAARRTKFTHAVPDVSRTPSAVKMIEDVGARMKESGVKGADQITVEATALVRSGEINLGPTLDAARAAEAQQAAVRLMTPGPGGETPLAAAKRLRNEVTVMKPVELPAEGRAGRDWLNSGLTTPDTPEFKALQDKVRVAKREFAENPTPENKEAIDLALSAAKKAYAKMAPDDAAKSQGSSHSELMRTAKSVMSTPAFAIEAKRLYGKLGYDVNIVPIVGTHEAMFEKYLTRYPKYLTGTEGSLSQRGTRITVVPYDEGKAILNAVEGVETKGGQVVGKMKVNTAGISAETITIVPITNAAGVDSMPTPWMITHGIFDSAAGNLLLVQGALPATKRIVESIERVFDRMRALEKEAPSIVREEDDNFVVLDGKGASEYVKLSDPRVVAKVKENALYDTLGYSFIGNANTLGTAVNSLWGRNTRSLFSSLGDAAKEYVDIAVRTGGMNPHEVGKYAEKLGIASKEEVLTLHSEIEQLRNRAAPMVKQKVTTAQEQPDSSLTRTKQGVRTVRNYVDRGQADHIAEIMTAAITKVKGYVPDLSFLSAESSLSGMIDPDQVKMVEVAAQEIAKILGPNGQNAKDAFSEDMRGNVLFVFPD